MRGEGVNNSKIKKLVIFLVIVVLFVAIGVTVWLLFRKGTGNLSLVIAPASSEIIIDGKNYTGRNNIKLEVGVHEITVDKFGFEQNTQTIEIKEAEETIFYVALEPIIQITQSWYDEHSEDAENRVLINEKNAEQSFISAIEDYPGIAELPYEGSNFKLSYIRCVPVEVYEEDCVLIDAKNKTARIMAINYFKDNIDADLGKYYFVYDESGNPFANGIYDVSAVPNPTKDIDGYGAVVFEIDGFIYRALFIKVYGEYVLSGVPAPILNYGSFIGIPEDVVREINEMEVK